MISRAELLAVIRSGQTLAPFVSTSNDKLVLFAGIVPLALLRRYLITVDDAFKKDRVWEWFLSDDNSPFTQLVDRRKILRSADYLRDNPHERTRLVDTQYDIKPLNVKPGQTYRTNYSVKGRNRQLLWHLVANNTRTGSKGEARGLERLFTFFRTPQALRAWRKYSNDPRFKLPEEAK